MEPREIVQVNLPANRNSHGLRKQTYGHKGGSGGGVNWEVGIGAQRTHTADPLGEIGS